jgi:signal transduction histidine kinase
MNCASAREMDTGTAKSKAQPTVIVDEEPLRNVADGLTSDGDLLHVARLLTVGELSTCFAHDVMNPLMMIRGNLGFMNETLPADHPARPYFEIIERAYVRVEEMAKRMLDFSRKHPTRLQHFDAFDIVTDAVRFMQPYFQEKHTEVKVSIAPGLPRILVDRWQFIQALVNIFQNAADAMAGTDSRELSIRVGRADSDVQIAISDSGRGIPEQILAKIFTPFFTTKGDRGTGLGLFITRRIIEEHGGTITVETTPQGATFVISLPPRVS